MGSKIMIGAKSDNWLGVNSGSPIMEKIKFENNFFLFFLVGQENDISLPMQWQYWFDLVCMAQKRISEIKPSAMEAFGTKILCIRKPPALSSLSKFPNFYKKGYVFEGNAYSCYWICLGLLNYDSVDNVGTSISNSKKAAPLKKHVGHKTKQEYAPVWVRAWNLKPFVTRYLEEIKTQPFHHFDFDSFQCFHSMYN